MTINMFTDILVLFGAFLALLICLGQLILERKDQKNYLFVLISFLIGFYQLSLSFHLFARGDGWFEAYKYVYIISRFSVYVMIPLTYLFFTSLPENSFAFDRKIWIHMILPVIVLILSIVAIEYPLPPGIRPEQYKDFLYFHNSVARLISNGSMLMEALYFSLLIKFYFGLFKNSANKRKENITVVIAIIILSLVFVGVYVLYYNGFHFLNNILKVRFTLLMVLVFVLTYRYPFIVNIIKLEAYRGYYRKSQIEKIEIDEVLGSLDILMDKEKIFKNQELSIKKTADMLKITPPPAFGNS